MKRSRWLRSDSPTIRDLFDVNTFTMSDVLFLDTKLVYRYKKKVWVIVDRYYEWLTFDNKLDMES
jgi:hypothetical protein